MTFKEMTFEQSETKFIASFGKTENGVLGALWGNHGPIMTVWFFTMLSTFVGLICLI